MFEHDARYSDNPFYDNEAGRQHRRRNFDLCNGLDMIKLSIVIDQMVEDGLHPRVAELYKTQAGALLAQLRSENNRNFKV